MKSLAELEAVKEKTLKKIAVSDSGKDVTRVVVGMATCGIAAGARPVYEALCDEVKAGGFADSVAVIETGCIGICQFEPVVEVFVPGKEKVTYVKMTAEKAKKVFEEHIKGGNIVKEYTIGGYSDPEKLRNGEEVPYSLNDTGFYKLQRRVALRNCGVIDPEDIDEYIAQDGYKALGKVLTEMKPADVISTVLASGLRGRGGAGFPTGRKWDFARK